MAEEHIDILDEQGKPTGVKLSRGDAHKQEAWHGVTHVWIYNKNNQLLLQLRHPDLEWGANKWDLPAGGHVLSGETPTQAVLREAKEEIGLQLKETELELAGITVTVNTTPATGRKHKTHDWNYIVEQDLDPKTVKLQADETIDLRWFNLDEFEADINDKEKFKKYTPRQPELYALVIKKIREKLAK